MPGYTHLQRAQVVTWGHWLLSHVWPLLRDRERFRQSAARAGTLPLGSGALAGTPYPIDRRELARALGFRQISQNSIDAVADRDFALEFLFAGATLGVHLSRLAEALILFATAEFGFGSFDEAHTTGSSLLPHKRNPDPLELARGKGGRLIGNLTALLTALKGLPSAYDKDLQEDKEPAFDSYETLRALLPVLTELITGLRTDPERMAAAVDPALYAADLADYLVARGLPFRQAHAAVGQAVLLAEERGVPLNQLPLEALRSISDRFDADVAQVFDVRAALARRDSEGGTSPRALRRQLEAARAALAEEAAS
jgi:argininosuccinate lyase